MTKSEKMRVLWKDPEYRSRQLRARTSETMRNVALAKIQKREILSFEKRILASRKYKKFNIVLLSNIKSKYGSNSSITLNLIRCLYNEL